MTISWKQGEEPINTSKAYGFRIKHLDKVKVMWIPISQVDRFDISARIADIPDWLYDKKIDELFLAD